MSKKAAEKRAKRLRHQKKREARATANTNPLPEKTSEDPVVNQLSPAWQDFYRLVTEKVIGQ